MLSVHHGFERSNMRTKPVVQPSRTSVSSRPRNLSSKRTFPPVICSSSSSSYFSLLFDAKQSITKLSNGVSVPQYILGDSCFPLLPWLITPYSSCSNEEEDSFETSRREFNNVHNRAVCTFGNAFARVRAHWQILDKKWKQEMVEFLPFVITTGCLLHNFMVNCGECSQDINTNRIDYNSELWMRKD